MKILNNLCLRNNIFLYTCPYRERRNGRLHLLFFTGPTGSSLLTDLFSTLNDTMYDRFSYFDTIDWTYLIGTRSRSTLFFFF